MSSSRVRRIFASACMVLASASMAAEPAATTWKPAELVPAVAAQRDIALALGGVLLLSGTDLTKAGERVRADALGNILLSAAEVSRLRSEQEQLENAMRRAECWWDFSRLSSPADQSSACATPEELRVLVLAAAPILERIDLALARSESSGLQHRSVGAVWSVIKLSLARMALDIHDRRFDAATQRWISLRTGLVRVRDAGNTGIWTAVLGLSESNSLQGLEALLFQGPSLGEQTREIVMRLLSDPGFSRARLQADLSAQHSLLQKELRQGSQSQAARSKVEQAFAQYAQGVLASFAGQADPIESIRKVHEQCGCRDPDFRLGVELLNYMRRRDIEADLLRMRAALKDNPDLGGIESLVSEFNRRHPGRTVVFDASSRVLRFVDPFDSVLQVRLK
jgi:hypothetical protein